MVTIPEETECSKSLRSFKVSSAIDSSEVATTPLARKIVAKSICSFNLGSSMVIIRMRLGKDFISMRTKVVLPEPDGPDNTQIDPFLDKLLVKTSNA